MLRLLLCIVLLRGVVDGGRADAYDDTTLLTYNIYLPNNSSLFYKARRQALFTAIDNTSTDSPFASSDVVCLQEALLEVDRAEVLRRARAVGYNYSFAGTLEDVSTLTGKACNPVHVLNAASCLDANCSGHDTITGTLPCSLGVCSDLVKADRQTCLNCVAEQAEGHFLNNIFKSCLAADASNYPTTMGLMLLSKKELSSSSIVSYSNTSELIPRGYIRSDIKDVGTIFCTHLFPNIEAAPALASVYEEQNKAQMKILLDVAANTPYAIIAGDLNNGPSSVGDLSNGASAGGGAKALFPRNFALANASGFSSPYGEASAAECTLCNTNPIKAAITFVSGIRFKREILDHVMVKPREFTVNTSLTRRVFTRRSVSTSTITVSISDHYGVQVTIRRIVPWPPDRKSRKTGNLSISAYYIIFPLYRLYNYNGLLWTTITVIVIPGQLMHVIHIDLAPVPGFAR